jgi:hypothetical protein
LCRANRGDLAAKEESKSKDLLHGPSKQEGHHLKKEMTLRKDLLQFHIMSARLSNLEWATIFLSMSSMRE